MKSIGRLLSILVIVGISFSIPLMLLSPRAKTQIRRAPANATTTADSQPSVKRALPERAEALKRQAVETYGKLPLSFEVNQGQTNSQVRFLSRGTGYSLFLTPTEAVFQFRLAGNRSLDANSNQSRNPQSSVLRMKLVGANSKPKVNGLDALPGKINYFSGKDPRKWRTNVSTYARVKYQNVYRGVDLVYYGNQNQLEYDLVVSPGADPKQIRLGFEGADKTEIDSQGDLILHTAGGEVRQRKPVIYQEVNGVRQQVSGDYVLHGKHQVRIQLGAYDLGKPLVIDPVLLYSTYLGGSVGDAGLSIAVDASRNAYITGETLSADFPTTPGAFDREGGPFTRPDAFVTKLNVSGSALIYSTFLARCTGYGIAVDSTGNAYVTGTGYVDGDMGFPTTPGAFQTTFSGLRDAFVAKLNPTGSALIYSTFLGGNQSDIGTGIAIDAVGNAYVSGETFSSNFPLMNPLQNANRGCADAFVTKLNATGTGLVYSTYLGGSDCENSSVQIGGGTAVDAGNGGSIAVDIAGNAYITGWTRSTDFPRANAVQSTKNGSQDAFITKLNATGTALVYSTYLGGSNSDEGRGIAVDAQSNVYIIGTTDSSNFPTTPGAFQTTYGSSIPDSATSSDAFVTKFNATGSMFAYSTYLGGSGVEHGGDIAVDAAGNACVSGRTQSRNFPTTNAFQTNINGAEDTFMTKFNATGTGLISSTYFGGNGSEFGVGIALDSVGDAYITGTTNSPDLPTTNSAFQSVLNGRFANAFVVKFATGTPTSLLISSILPNRGGDTGTVSVIIHGDAISPGASVKLVRVGQPDIVGNPVNVGAGGRTISASFDLRGKTRGLWDVVVTNSDGTSARLPEGFTIEEGGKAQLWVDIIGRDVMGRAGGTYNIIYGNRANVNIYDIVLFIRIPKGTSFSIKGLLPLAILPPPELDIGPGVELDSEILIPIWFYVIPAKFTGSIHLDLRPATGTVEDIFVKAELLMPPPSDFSQTGMFSFTPYHIDLLAQFLAKSMIKVLLESASTSAREADKSQIDNAILVDDCLSAVNPEVCLRDEINKVLKEQIVQTQQIIDPINYGNGLALDRSAASAWAAAPIGGVRIPFAASISGINSAVNLYSLYLAGQVLENVVDKINGEKNIRVVSSIDPNEKVGSQGAGQSHYLSGEEPLRYIIFFENLETATAPAQEVVITDQLDSVKLDLNTLSLGPIGFGEKLLNPPPGLSEFNQDVDLRPAKNLIVRINARLDKSTGLLTWRFTALDPVTGLPPDDPLAGFLPPNRVPPEGEGSVLFTVMPKQGLATGAEIRNQARIIFDTNAPIDTPQWFNTLDNTKPTSNVLSFPAMQNSASFQVQWQGTDVGSGVLDYSIFVSENGGSFTPWLRTTPTTSGTFTGQPGKTYAFYSIARDRTGNIEAVPIVADATTRVASADMVITKTASPSPVQIGSNITYTIGVSNNGSNAATAVTVSDNLPASTTFISCSATSGGVCGGSGNNRTANFGSLASGASATITLVAKVNPSLANNTAISNTATVTSSTPDPVLTNNSATTTTMASNTPPTITGATIMRQQGTPASSLQIATVSDVNQAANTLVVKVNSASSATVNGVIVSGLSVNGAGAVTASVAASCTASNASFTLTVTDTQSAMASAQLNVNVTTNAPPTVTASVAQISLWPPNHNLVNVGLAVSLAGNCTGNTTVQVMVYGDEDDNEETGDGNHSPDAKDFAPGTLRLRSERKGNGDGRVYLIVVKPAGAGSNVSFGCATVVVPKSQSQADKNSVNAQAASAKAYFQSNGVPPPGYFVIGDGPIIGPKQ